MPVLRILKAKPLQNKSLLSLKLRGLLPGARSVPEYEIAQLVSAGHPDLANRRFCRREQGSNLAVNYLQFQAESLGFGMSGIGGGREVLVLTDCFAD